MKPADTKTVRFSYDPLDYIVSDLTACLTEDGNLVINVDRENALKSCFSEDGIQMFYIIDDKENKVEKGSNNVMQKEIKSEENLQFKIENKGRTKFFETKNNENCGVKIEISSVIGIVSGSVCLGKGTFTKSL